MSVSVCFLLIFIRGGGGGEESVCGLRPVRDRPVVPTKDPQNKWPPPLALVGRFKALLQVISEHIF